VKKRAYREFSFEIETKLQLGAAMAASSFGGTKRSEPCSWSILQHPGGAAAARCGTCTAVRDLVHCASREPCQFLAHARWTARILCALAHRCIVTSLHMILSKSPCLLSEQHFASDVPDPRSRSLPVGTDVWLLAAINIIAFPHRIYI